LADGISSWISAEVVVWNTIAALAGEQAPAILESLSGRAITGEPLIEYVSEKVGDVEAEQPSNYVLPGYLVMFVFFAAALSSEAIVRERQNHTLERLLASSVRRSTIIGGIFTGTAAKGLVQIIIFWTVGILVFKLDLGIAPAAVIILSFLMVIVSAAFGVMLATLVKTDRGAGSIATLAALIMAPLGGCWWPLFVTPKGMQLLAKFTPHGWANDGFNKLMLFGADFADVTPEMLALVVFTIIFGSIAVWRFRAAAA
jgi:ABC-2 type transport system permease protein